MESFKEKLGIIWKTLCSRIALIVSASVLVFLLTITLILTQVPFLTETFHSMFGGPPQRREGEGNVHFTSDYESKEKTLEEANALSLDIVSEGIVLLKNESNALPITGGKRVTVFGKNSVSLVIGGSGSSKSSATNLATVYSSLEGAGFAVNPTVRSFYENNSQSGPGRGSNPAMGVYSLAGFATGETPIASFNAAQVKSSYENDYKDAAIVVIGRIGGEGFDLPTSMKTSLDGSTLVDGAGSPNDHYLELDANEKAIIQEACSSFSKVILVLNCSAPMELGFLDDGSYPNIKAALSVGLPGAVGIDALGKILNGSITPSGHLADTYARDFTKDPTLANFAKNGNSTGNQYTNEDGTGRNAYFVDYKEGIYVGYRYYETRGAADAVWYAENVVYPFGHGLSYTEFSWTLKAVKDQNGNTVTSGLDAGITKDTELTFTVEVTNEGETYAGKEVVQLYVNAPHFTDGIEKSHVVLADFAKTEKIAPGDKGEVELTVSAYDFASYDWDDANNNQFKGYELDAGAYNFKLMKDAHTSVLGDFTAYVKGTGVQFDKDPVTGVKIENRFDDVSEHILDSNNRENNYYLSRGDWTGTFPTKPTDSDRKVSQTFYSSLNYSYGDKSSDPWYTTQMPTQASAEVDADNAAVKLYELLGKDYDDDLWDDFLDQITVAQLSRLVGTGNYQTFALANLGKPKTTDPDGPSGFTIFMNLSPDTAPVYGTCTYPGETVLACTFNKDLAYRMGRMIGNEGVWGDVRGDKTPYSGWYAPAMNIHRSPFSGRNWEYYSEDSILSGKLASLVVQGAKEKGVYAYLKHFAVNDQETDRDTNGLVTWATEQSMREIYLKPFELCVKARDSENNRYCTAVMSSFNRIGTTWAGGDYRLLTNILREEWGFRGMVITDYALGGYMNSDQMLRAGGDLKLNQNSQPGHRSSATDVSVMRQAAKNILYTVANSNAMNGLGEAVKIYYDMAPWIIILIVIDSVIAGGLIGWCAVTIIIALKKSKQTDQST